MKVYEKPEIMHLDSQAEGVYLASGCFTTSVTVDQWDTDEKRFHVYIYHDADHHSNQQKIIVSFPNTLSEITFVESGQVTRYEKNGNTLVIYATRHQNGSDNTSFNFGAKFSDVAYNGKPGQPTAVCDDVGMQSDHNNC